MGQRKTTEAARGKWKSILTALGVPGECLKNLHGPCPMCGGRDRFRWDNKEGSGSYFCSNCGAGGGMDLAMAFTKTSFAETAREIDNLLGNAKPDPKGSNGTISPGLAQKYLKELWEKTYPLTRGDFVEKYLNSRGLDGPLPSGLRYAPIIGNGEGSTSPCMVAVVCDRDGKAVTLHRTFLNADGTAKANLKSARKLMPGPIPDVVNVQLMPYLGGTLGIAEGIETALSASKLFRMPVWAALDADKMVKWKPPEGCNEVVIYGDNDHSYTGQAAAYTLAKRLTHEKINVAVSIPSRVGDDWNDRLIRARDTSDD